MSSERLYLIGGRRTGRTTRLLRWAQAAPEGEHRVIVSHTYDESRRLLRLSREQDLGLESWQFVSQQEIDRTDRSLWSGVLIGRGGQMSLGLDNLDMYLDGLIGWRVGAASITAGPRLELLGDPDGHSEACAFMLQALPGQAECDCGYAVRIRRHAMLWLQTEEARKALADALHTLPRDGETGKHLVEDCEVTNRVLLDELTQNREIQVDEL